MTTKPWVLGISCSHNGSACLLHGDQIVAAVQDERLLRFKRRETNGRFVEHCINYCLGTGGIQPRMLDMIVWSETRGGISSSHQDLFLNDVLRACHNGVPVQRIPHHYAHAMSAFAVSGYRSAAVLVIDGSGTLFEHLPAQEQAAVINHEAGVADWEWVSCYEAADATLTPVFKQTGRFSHYGPGQEQFDSIGNMYGMTGKHIFRSFFDGPGKVMGLAAYGNPIIPVEELLLFEEETGIIRFKWDAFRAVASQCSWPSTFERCADLAASVQRAAEYAIDMLVRKVRSISQSASLCYAGGVALNSIVNERIIRSGGFDHVFIMPAAEDSGVAVGAAYHGLWELLGRNTGHRLRHDAMGRTYNSKDIDDAIASTPGLYVQISKTIANDIAALLCEGKVVGFFAGRSELGPRSLGQRSILCDPRRQDIKEKLNSSIKFRERFRPFAAAILHDRVHEWFDVPSNLVESPFMLRVWTFHPGKADLVPAVSHIDSTARIQTLTADVTPLLYEVVKCFFERTGVPIVLNTSFNVAGEPIVETPEDALWCLITTGMECCAFEDRVVYKSNEFGSLLDLRARVSATAIITERPVSDGRISSQDTAKVEDTAGPGLMPFHPDEIRQLRSRRLGREGGVESFSYAYVRTRWGESAIPLSNEHLRLLSIIDGKLTGHAILHMRKEWSAEWLITTLVGLYRAAIIRFER